MNETVRTREGSTAARRVRGVLWVATWVVFGGAILVPIAVQLAIPLGLVQNTHYYYFQSITWPSIFSFAFLSVFGLNTLLWRPIVLAVDSARSVSERFFTILITTILFAVLSVVAVAALAFAGVFLFFITHPA